LLWLAYLGINGKTAVNVQSAERPAIHSTLGIGAAGFVAYAVNHAKLNMILIGTVVSASSVIRPYTSGTDVNARSAAQSVTQNTTGTGVNARSAAQAAMRNMTGTGVNARNASQSVTRNTSGTTVNVRDVKNAVQSCMIGYT